MIRRLTICLAACFATIAKGEQVEAALVIAGSSAWSQFACVRVADETSGSLDFSQNEKFERALIAARGFLAAYSDQLISSSSMVQHFTATDERRFLFGPNVEFKLGSMVTLATLEADAALESQGSSLTEYLKKHGCEGV